MNLSNIRTGYVKVDSLIGRKHNYMPYTEFYFCVSSYKDGGDAKLIG
jgi:hypothetical protein